MMVGESRGWGFGFGGWSWGAGGLVFFEDRDDLLDLDWSFADADVLADSDLDALVC